MAGNHISAIEADNVRALVIESNHSSKNHIVMYVLIGDLYGNIIKISLPEQYDYLSSDLVISLLFDNRPRNGKCQVK